MVLLRRLNRFNVSWRQEDRGARRGAPLREMRVLRIINRRSNMNPARGRPAPVRATGAPCAFAQDEGMAAVARKQS